MSDLILLECKSAFILIEPEDSGSAGYMLLKDEPKPDELSKHRDAAPPRKMGKAFVCCRSLV